jgi:hypothetical protein
MDGPTSHEEADPTPLPVTNLHLTATTGLFGVRRRAKKSDMLLTIMAHHHSRMDRRSSRLTSALPWTTLAASVCAFAQQPKPSGVKLLRRQVMPDFAANAFWLRTRIPPGGGNILDFW